MSDYLSNLVARSFSRTGAIQPRLGTLFEPRQSLGESLEEQSLELEENRVFYSPRSAPPLPSQPLEPDPLPPLPENLLSISTQTKEDTPPISAELQRPTPELTVQQISTEQVTESVKPLLETSPPRNSVVIQPQIVPVSERSLPLTSPIHQSQLVPLPDPAAASMPTAKTEPPTIQVTIGRVEVRAIAPPPSPRQPPQPSVPKLSLEDYLKSRSGGRG